MHRRTTRLRRPTLNVARSGRSAEDGLAQPLVEPCSRGIIAAEPCPRELGREIPPQRRRLVLAACVLASSMAFIDGSALTVAVPGLRAELVADLASVEWVLNADVSSAPCLPLPG